MRALALTLLAAAAGCTRPNPAVCCLDAADCDEVGIPEVRGCAEGLACVEHQCTVPTCAEAGCGATAPVCNVVTDVCDPCTSSDDCARFADTPVCETTSGGCVQCTSTPDCTGFVATPVCETTSHACVECLMSGDCPPLKPVCDGTACRAPKVDAECSSGAMADDGSCVGESDVVYLDPNGTDVGSCTRTVPCRTVAFGVSVTTAARNHIVFAPGQYPSAEESYGPGDTQAPALHFHGHGAEVLGPQTGDSCVFGLALSATVRDLKVSVRNATGAAFCITTGPTLLERVETAGASFTFGVQLSAPTTIRDYKHVGGFVGVQVQDSLTLDRAVIRGSRHGIITAATGYTVQLSNVLIYDTTDRGLDFVDGTSGTVASTTVVTSGTGFSGTGARAVACPSTVLVRSSIIWAPSSGTQPPASGCTMTNVIAGPANVVGTMNVDPLFVNAGQDDYHLAVGSPARDAVDTGPTTDFEGQLRPQGARFDLGADEAAP